MKTKLCSLAFFVAGLTLVLNLGEATAAAQTTGDDYPRAEFYAGYSHLRITSGGSTGLNGFNLSVTGNFTKYLGLKGDLSGNYKADFGTTFSFYNFLAGIQIKNNSRAERLKPFAHALVGGARLKASPSGFGSFSDTGLAMAFGGGLDVRAGKHLDVRVVQIDYNPIHIAGGTNHNARLGAGIVIH
jgi:hypothetical protein